MLLSGVRLCILHYVTAFQTTRENLTDLTIERQCVLECVVLEPSFDVVIDLLDVLFSKVNTE